MGPCYEKIFAGIRLAGTPGFFLHNTLTGDNYFPCFAVKA